MFKSKDEVVDALGADVVDVLTVFEKDGNICLKPKSFLGKDTFNDILGRVRDIGGKYEGGLFKIPLAAEKPKEVSATYEEVYQMIVDLKNYVDKSVDGIAKKLGDLKPKKSNSDKG